MNKKLVLSLTLFIVLVMAFSVCAEPMKTVKIGLSGSVTSSAPFASTNEFAEPILNTLYETLFVKPTVSSTETQPCIGKSWEYVDDRTAAIEIFDYIHDVDNNPITAKDVVFSYEKAKELNINTDTAYIESATATGDYSLELRLTEPNNTTMIKLLTHILIVNEDAWNVDHDTTPGTKAYKLVSYTSGAEYVCENLHNYWQTDESQRAYMSAANVDRIVFEIITEPAQTTTALETGEIQMAIAADGREAARFEEGGEDEDGFTVDTNAGSFSLVLLFNCTDESLGANEDFRKACLYAIDTNVLVRIVLNNAGTPAKDMASNQLAGYNPKWLEEDYYNSDIDKAKEYLAKSGYNGETIKLEGASSYSGELQLIQAQLGAIGVKSEIQTFENALWQEEKVAGTGSSSWDICVDGLGGSVVTSAWNVKFNPANFVTGKPQTGYLDETLQELISKAHNSQEQADIDAAHDYIKDKGYSIGLYASAAKCIMVDTITDMVYSFKGFAAPASANYDNYEIYE